MSIGYRSLPLSLLILLIAVTAWGQDSVPSAVGHAQIVHHHLTVELNTTAHELTAQDEVTINVPGGLTTLTFTLAPSLQIDSIRLRDQLASGQVGTLSYTTDRLTEPSTQRVVVTLPAAGPPQRTVLVWTYRGILNDPPTEPRHLRFVTPSETAGHVGPEGIYLSSESQWYPDIQGSFSAFEITAEVPQQWTVVTQGTQTQETVHNGTKVSTWVVRDRSEALTLVANTFVTKTRTWQSPSGRPVQLATFFFPDNAGLADEYLEATAKYLDAYVSLLGEYPFEKFAVVENFFASGLGMPSFTLLGSGSIKRHYVQPYALGHEIVHSWIGNSVFNRADSGNWVEGLTTYLANYYWHELTGDEAQAREQRRLMLQGYSLYVSPDRDYPVGHFTRKRDEHDNAIGYQKAAFMFHLLRHEIGDETFWRAVKILTTRYKNRPADWGSLERIFAEESRKDLRWFFAQWVEQPGAPVLSLGNLTASRLPSEEAGERWELNVRIQQAGKPFRVAIPLQVVMKDGSETHWVTISDAADTVKLGVPFQPLRVRLDPDLMTFRQVAREQLPPMLNLYVTDRHRAVVQAFPDTASPLQQVVARIAGQEAPLPSDQKAAQIPADKAAIPSTGSLLILATGERQTFVRPLIEESCGSRVMFQEQGFQIDGRSYEGPGWAVLLSCHRANVPGSVITVLYGVTPQAVEKVARLLFYYGWHSVVIFHEGAVKRREAWDQEADMKEVQVHANQ
jgi:aminopeptidase N